MPSLFPKPTSMLKLPIILEGAGNKLSIIASHVAEYLGIPLLWNSMFSFLHSQLNLTLILLNLVSRVPPGRFFLNLNKSDLQICCEWTDWYRAKLHPGSRLCCQGEEEYQYFPTFPSLPFLSRPVPSHVVRCCALLCHAVLSCPVLSRPVSSCPVPSHPACPSLLFSFHFISLTTASWLLARFFSLLQGYIPEFSTCNVPIELKNKEREVFSNIQDIYEWHSR